LACFVYGPVLAAIAAVVLLAVVRVGRAWAVWLPGAPLGLVFLGLTAYLLAQAGAGSWARGVGVPSLTPFVIGNSLAAALALRPGVTAVRPPLAAVAAIRRSRHRGRRDPVLPGG